MSRPGGSRSAPTCCGRMRPTGGPWSASRPRSPARSSRTSIACAAVATTGAPWQLFRTRLAYAAHRVVWPDLARRLAAVVPDPEVVPLNTVYGLATRSADDAHALAALFNSRWLTALARLRADPARGGFRRFNARVVRELPVPADPAAWRTLAARGREHVSDDAAIADVYQLDAGDRRALAELAPDPF